MKITNIYKIALVSGAMAATGFAFASFSGSTGSTATPKASPSPPTAIAQKDTDKETNDDLTSKKAGIPSDVKDAKAHVSDENQKETKDDNITLPVGTITEDAAKKAVLAIYPKGEIVGIETEDENGIPDYNVSLKDGTDVKIDVLKGTVLKTDKRDSEEKVGTGKEKADDSTGSAKDGAEETEED